MVQICTRLLAALTLGLALGRLVGLRVEHDSQLFEVAADGGAERGPVLADAAGEDDHVGAAQFDQVRAEIMPHVGGNTSRASFARALPAAAASSMSRRSPLTPLKASSPP